MNRIIFAIVLSLFAGSAMAEPLVLQVDAKPVHKMATAVQARRGFHLPPLPPPLVFPGTNPTPQATGPTDLATFLATVAIPDLQNALALANSQTPPDATAAACWGGLIPVVQQIQSVLPQTNGTTPMGVATAVQIALRDFINAPTSPVIKQVNLACAPLYMDTKVGLVNFAAQFAGIFAGAAIISPIKPLPIP